MNFLNCSENTHSQNKFRIDNGSKQLYTSLIFWLANFGVLVSSAETYKCGTIKQHLKQQIIQEICSVQLFKVKTKKKLYRKLQIDLTTFGKKDFKVI